MIFIFFIKTSKSTILSCDVFACRSYWFIVFFVSVAIGQSNCFCFAITTLKKTALTRDSNLLTDSKESIKNDET